MIHYKGTKLKQAFLVSFLLTLSLALTAYINSSFLGQYMDDKAVGSLYAIGAFIAILILTQLPKLLQKFGPANLFRVGMSLNILTILGLVTLTSPLALKTVFVLYIASFGTIIFALDIIVEHFSKNSTTGTIRGVYQTLASLAYTVAPLAAGFLVERTSFKGPYMAAGVIVAILFLIFFSKIGEIKPYPKLHKRSFFKNLLKVIKNKNIVDVYFTDLALQTYFVISTIYIPLYLYDFMNFSWGEIGVILAIMHVPYLILEIPIGSLADKKYGEKEMMNIGVVILGIATIGLFFIGKPNLAIWSLVLGITRIGASFMQVMTESYFFKQVTDDDTETISIFRSTTYVGLLVGPLLATIFLSFFEYRKIFLLMAILILISIMFSSKIKDTK